MSGAFGDDVRLAGEAIWKVLLASIVLGAGLPAIFALGIRSLAWGTGGAARPADGSGTARIAATGSGNPVGKAVAAVLFLVVAYGIVAGLVFVIASGQGKDISFTHVIPTITAKAS